MPDSCDITKHNMTFRVRYCEVDRQNAVHHSIYATYFEMGRTELLRVNGCDYKTLEDSGIWLVMARLEVRFKAPAQYDDELLLTTTLGSIDRMRLEHHYELTRPADGQTIANGKTVLVHVDSDRKLQRLPQFLFPKSP